MKSIAEYEVENAAAVAKYESKRRAALRRLKQRIANMLNSSTLYTGAEARQRVNVALEAWAEKERRRG